jgi:response regulator NasT
MKRRLRVAVADDEAFLRRYFQEVLADMGHEVVCAARNGRELVEHCAASPPDLVISDIRMPEMDGIEAALEISRGQAVPMILVSAFHDPDLIERAEKSHVMAYLVKPIERADLETAIAIATRRFEQLVSLVDEAAELRRTLEDRKLIERAKGVLMKRAGMSEEEAFRRMQKLSCDKNKKLVEIARMILAAEPAMELFG